MFSFAPVRFLAQLFNGIIDQEYFSSEMKYTRFIPLLKYGSLKSRNFRPVALIKTISNVFEKFYHQKIDSFLVNFKTLNDHQFGFRMNRSTIDALSIVNGKFPETENRYHNLVSSFLFFRKTFHTVNHSLLLGNLHNCRIWGKSVYLLER